MAMTPPTKHNVEHPQPECANDNGGGASPLSSGQTQSEAEVRTSAQQRHSQARIYPAHRRSSSKLGTAGMKRDLTLLRQRKRLYPHVFVDEMSPKFHDGVTLDSCCSKADPNAATSTSDRCVYRDDCRMAVQWLCWIMRHRKRSAVRFESCFPWP